MNSETGGHSRMRETGPETDASAGCRRLSTKRPARSINQTDTPSTHHLYTPHYLLGQLMGPSTHDALP